MFLTGSFKYAFVCVDLDFSDTFDFWIKLLELISILEGLFFKELFYQ